MNTCKHEFKVTEVKSGTLRSGYFAVDYFRVERCEKCACVRDRTFVKTERTPR